jgi:hypothetical protein
LRYDCYERIGLERRKDREYCDNKYKGNKKKFACVEYFDLQRGAEYCYYTYSWDTQYQELYDCLAEEGVETHAGYCALKHKSSTKDELWACLFEMFEIE